MQQILEESLRCGCMSLEECVIFVRQAHETHSQVVDAEGGHGPVD